METIRLQLAKINHKDVRLYVKKQNLQEYLNDFEIDGIKKLFDELENYYEDNLSTATRELINDFKNHDIVKGLLESMENEYGIEVSKKVEVLLKQLIYRNLVGRLIDKEIHVLDLLSEH
jgi:hypothetical protein